ncbi:MAG: hypothetical protein LQ339_006652 [Xanthoria mediterranea]|nr:MAG: hypothetical protein LQ339_006652 [Xanthoria mediterranea]
MERKMIVVAVMAPNATDEPITVQLTAAAMKTTKSPAFTGIRLTPPTFLNNEDPGKILSRESANNRSGAAGSDDLYKELGPVVRIGGIDQGFKVLYAEQDEDQGWYGENCGRDGREPHAPCHVLAGIFRLLGQVCGGIVAAEFPSAEQQTNHPAICIRGLLARTQVDAVVESGEDEACGLESPCHSNRKPGPEEKEQNKEDGNGNAEISLQPGLAADVRDQSYHQTGDYKKPREPALVKNSSIGVVDLKCRNKKLRGALLSAGD